VVNDIRGIGPDAADHGRRHARLKSQAEKDRPGAFTVMPRSWRG
jgi:hypothetical protein